MMTITILVLAWTLLWAWLHPPTPLHSGNDLYEQLTVARHLVDGDGFQCDIAYPLSATFPFAARLPQPLIHRPPGFSLLLTTTVMASDDPARIIEAVRILQLFLLGGIAWIGALALGRRDRFEAMVLWLLLLMVNPLLDMGARWGHVEVAVALVLMIIWTHTGQGTMRFGLIDGLLAGMVALLRLELFWLPWLWFGARAIRRGQLDRRWIMAALTIWVLMMTPWTVRNWKVTGDPFFSLQSHAEHRKDTAALAGVSPYLTMDPESLTTTLLRDPVPILRKTARGLLYQVDHLRRWLPWPLLLAGLVAVLAGRRRRRHQQGDRDSDSLRFHLLLSGFSLGLCALLYAPLSHDPRHMLPMLPILSLELVHAAVLMARSISRSAVSRWSALAVLTILLVVLVPARMPGWEKVRQEAIDNHPRILRAVQEARDLPPGPILVDQAAVLWYSGRAGMIKPPSEEDTSKLRNLMIDLRDAPVVTVPLDQLN